MVSKAILICIGLVVGVAIIATLLATSLKKLQTYEVGIIYNKITKKLHDDPKFEGLHLGPPGYKFIKFPNVYQTKTFGNIVCLNQNGVRIVLDVSCQFKVQIPAMKKVIIAFKDFSGFETVLQYAGVAAIHEACSNFTTAEFQERRESFQKLVKEIMEIRFNELNAVISGVQVNNIKRPGRYESAIRDKERAREDILVAKQERPKQLIEAETKMKEAKSISNITLERARSRARIRKKQAEAEAESILIQYEKEAETLQNVLKPNGLNYTNDGFLQYMAIRIISSLNNTLYVGMNFPEHQHFRVLPPPRK